VRLRAPSRWLFAGGLCAAALAGAATAQAKVAWFLSPSGNLGCEVADHDPRGAYAFCQSNQRPQTVRMAVSGRLRICRGVHCLGDPPENTPTLPYGRRVRVGRFGCTSEQAGIRCTVIATGKGFVLDRKTVRPIR
jgi:hypothetical protein